MTAAMDGAPLPVASDAHLEAVGAAIADATLGPPPRWALRDRLRRARQDRADQLGARRLTRQLATCGPGLALDGAQDVFVTGERIHLGAHVLIMATPSAPTTIVCRDGAGLGPVIRIGAYTVLHPGVQLEAARGITIGSNAMLARGAAIVDNDGHGVHDRLSMGPSAPVTIGDDVWIGRDALILKGVTIGDRSIVGAKSLVTRDVPADTIVGGVPAVPIGVVDPRIPVTSRQQFHEALAGEDDAR